MFANNAIDTFDALLRKNIYGLKKRIFNINNDLIRVMYNCFEIVNGPTWISWANSIASVITGIIDQRMTNCPFITFLVDEGRHCMTVKFNEQDNLFIYLLYLFY